MKLCNVWIGRDEEEYLLKNELVYERRSNVHLFGFNEQKEKVNIPFKDWLEISSEYIFFKDRKNEAILKMDLSSWNENYLMCLEDMTVLVGWQIEKIQNGIITISGYVSNDYGRKSKYFCELKDINLSNGVATFCDGTQIVLNLLDMGLAIARNRIKVPGLLEAWLNNDFSNIEIEKLYFPVFA